MNLFYSLLFYYICDFLWQSQYLTLIFCIRSIQLCLQIEHQNSFSCLSLSQAFMTTNHLTVNNINVHENRNESKIQYINTSNTGLLKYRRQNEALTDYWETADVLYLGSKPSAPGNTQVPEQEGLSGCVCYIDVKTHVRSEKFCFLNAPLVAFSQKIVSPCA